MSSVTATVGIIPTDPGIFRGYFGDILDLGWTVQPRSPEQGTSARPS